MGRKIGGLLNLWGVRMRVLGECGVLIINLVEEVRMFEEGIGGIFGGWWRVAEWSGRSFCRGEMRMDGVRSRRGTGPEQFAGGGIRELSGHGVRRKRCILCVIKASRWRSREMEITIHKQ